MSGRGGIALAAAVLTACATLGCAAAGGVDGYAAGSLAGAAGGAAGAGGGHGLASVPASAPELVNPFGESPAAVAGHKLFVRHCAECHGDDGRGGRRGPSLDSRRMRQASPGALFWFLTNGRLAAGMPEWSRLPAARRWQIIAYLQGRLAGRLPDERGVYSPTSRRERSP